MKTLNAYSQQNVYIPTVNKIHIQKLNESIISKDDINNIQVKGTKTFIEGFQTTNLHVNNTILSSIQLYILSNYRLLVLLAYHLMI